jgi:hypothetical protein
VRKYKGYIISFLAGATLMSATGAYASVGDKLEAIVTHFDFVVNGKKVNLTSDVVTINDSSYLPVRAVSNMLGYDVTYKADSRTIELNNGSTKQGIPKDEPAPTPNATPNSPQPSISPTSDTPVSTSEPKTDVERISKKLVVNGSQVIPETLIQNKGTVLIPIRTFSEALGLQASWDEQTKTITLRSETTTLSIIMNSYTANFNGRTIQLEEAPIIFDGSTMIPVRAAEIFNAKVDISNDTIEISK